MIGWDWQHVARLAHDMLYTMRRSCNKYAEQQGHGEPSMDDQRLVEWMTILFCEKICAEKKAAPGATREDIRFNIGDRWKLPIIPFTRSMLTASLCKGPDHGIAMKFGILEPADGEAFDPLKHFNHSQRTVTIDTWGYQQRNVKLQEFGLGRHTKRSLRHATTTFPLEDTQVGGPEHMVCSARSDIHCCRAPPGLLHAVPKPG